MQATVSSQPQIASPRARARSIALRSPAVVAGSVLAMYAVWIVAYLLAGHDIRDFIVIGREFVLKSTVSTSIRFDPTFHYPTGNPLGYDGQWSYFMAIDPLHARYYMDFPAYRYTRVLYPLIARLITGGAPALVPWALVAINWLAVGAGTFAVALWLTRRNLSPWLALIYGCYIGIFIGVQADLTEPLSFGLIAFAVLLMDGKRANDWVWSAILFALAMVTRETTGVFAGIYAAAILLAGGRNVKVFARAARNWRQAVIFASIAAGPLLLYKMLLMYWLHSVGVPSQMQLAVIPFSGLMSYWPFAGHRLIELDSVVLPALICLGLTTLAIWKHRLSAPVAILLANIVLFVLLLPRDSYVDIFASSRITTGVVLGTLYCLPVFDRLTRGKRHWLAVVVVLWQVFLPVQLLELLINH